MALSGGAIFAIIFVVVLLLGGGIAAAVVVSNKSADEQKQKDDASKTAAAGASSGYGSTTSSGGTSESVKTEVWGQADEICVIKVNDKQKAEIKGWSLQHVTFNTKVGDVVSFHVKNTGGPGGLRAQIKRGDAYYSTGDASDTFYIKNQNKILVKNAEKWGNDLETALISRIWNKGIDAPVKYSDAQWIWDESECSDCTVVFVVNIK